MKSQSCRGVEVAGWTFDRKVEGSRPDRNIIGCRQEGHPDIKWLTVPSKSPAMQAPSNPQYWEKRCKMIKKIQKFKSSYIVTVFHTLIQSLITSNLLMSCFSSTSHAFIEQKTQELFVQRNVFVSKCLGSERTARIPTWARSSVYCSISTACGDSNRRGRTNGKLPKIAQVPANGNTGPGEREIRCYIPVVSYS